MAEEAGAGSQEGQEQAQDQQQQPGAESGQQDQQQAQDQGAANKPDKQAEEPEWLQKRIDRAVRRQHEAEREAAVYRQLLEAERQNKAQPKGDQARTPTAEEFERMTPAQQAALVAAEVARRTLEQEQTRATQTLQEQTRAREQAEIQQKAQRQRDAGVKKYEDFEEVALSEDVTISDAMAQAITDSEFGPDIAYFLGKNRKDAERIAKLPPIAAAREIGKLEAKFVASSDITKAPAPGKPVGARGGASTGLRDDMPLSDWMTEFDKTMRRR